MYAQFLQTISLCKPCRAKKLADDEYNGYICSSLKTYYGKSRNDRKDGGKDVDH
jgi:hypothetical protein